MTTGVEYDLAIVGGGLAGSLTALAFAARHPDVSLCLLESDDRLGGNHIWSFFDSDVDSRDRWLVEPLIAHRWAEGYEVRFPGHCRGLAVPYNSITSARLDSHVRRTLGNAVLTGAEAAELTPVSVTLADGRVLQHPARIFLNGVTDTGPSFSCTP